MEVSQKLKNSTAITAIPLFGILSEWNISNNSKWYMHPHVQWSIIYNSQDLEATQVSTDGRVDEEQIRLLQDMPQWHIDYIELKVLVK